ncbi:MAG: Mu transposase C-terminal domain-containing protein [Acidimicrobiales bacterium]
MAEAVGAAAASLGIDARPVRAYSPHLKGTVERVHRSIEGLFLAELPGFVRGPKDRRGHLVEDDLPLLPLKTVVMLFADFVHRYHGRPHEGLGGASPLERWCADATPLEVVPPDRLRHLLLARVERTVTKRGIRLEGRTYNCAELCGYVGETVEVRYLPRHHHAVEVFRHGAHLGTAQAADELDPLEAKRLLRRRAEEARWLAERQRSAARRRRKAYAVLTGEGLGDWAPPIFDLDNYAAYLDFGMAFANALREMPLPATGMVVNLPRVTTPTKAVNQGPSERLSGSVASRYRWAEVPSAMPLSSPSLTSRPRKSCRRSCTSNRQHQSPVAGLAVSVGGTGSTMMGAPQFGHSGALGTHVCLQFLHQPISRAITTPTRKPLSRPGNWRPGMRS